MTDAHPHTARPAAPLDGVSVVELANYISGPLAALVLADLGAHVTKVEPPDGDAMRRLSRHHSGVNPMWLSSNRGKHGRRLDLKEPGEHSSMLDLIRRADVFVTNLRPPALGRLGLDDDTLTSTNERLIRLYVTGYGLDGPYAAHPVFDTIMQAETGLTDALADGDRPRLDRYFSVDKAAAMIGAQAVLAALYARATTGRADRIDLAMFDAAAYFFFPDTMINRTLLADADRPARNEHASAIRPLETADGWLVVLPVAGSQVAEALRIAGVASLVDEVLGAPSGPDVTRRMFDALEPALATRPTAHWIEAFNAASIPVAPCRRLDEALTHPQAEVNGLYSTAAVLGDERLGMMRYVRYPASYDGVPAGPQREPTGEIRLPE